MSFSIKTNFKQVEKMLNDFPKKAKKEYDNAVNVTAQYGLRKIKTKINKGSGSLRRSYTRRRTGILSQQLYSNLKYADGVESGFKRGAVRPKNKKYLLFAVDRAARRLDGGVRAGAARRFFRVAKETRSLREATNQTGVVMTKFSGAASYEGSHVLRDEVLPLIDKNFIKNIDKANQRIII